MSENKAVLPEDPAKAVKHVTGIVEKLLALMERESKAMATQDSVSFTAIQQEKQALSESYQQCAAEFRARLTDFRNVDKTMLDRLDGLQRELAAKSRENMAVMERMSG